MFRNRRRLLPIAALAIWVRCAWPCQAAGPPPAGAVHLPLLSSAGGCAAEVAVQNIGSEVTKAALLTWGATTSCPGADGPCAAPIRLLCSGLLAPGRAWTFDGSAFGPDATSGIVYSFNVRRLSELGSGITPDGPAADYLCVVLAAAVVGSCDNFRSFKTAYDAGASFAGVRLALAYGGELAVDVRRRCGDDGSAGSSRYSGIAGRAFGGRDQVFNWSSYYAPAIEEDAATQRHSTLYLQNGGAYCASVEVWLIEPATGCGRIRWCRSVFLAPGSALALNTAGCLKPGIPGSAWLRSSEPLAVAVEVTAPRARARYGHVAVPAEIQPAVDEPPVFTAGSTVAHGPLPPPADGPAETRVHVQNLSSVSMSRVRVTFLDGGGSGTGPAEATWLCPRGSHTFTPPAWRETRSPPAAVRVESLPWRDVDGATVAAPNVSATVTERHAAGDSGPNGTAGGDQWLSYNLPSQPGTGDWRTGGTPGSRLLAVPRIVWDRDTSTRIIVANTVTQPGQTQAAVLLYDANGPVAVRCLTLPAGGTRAVDAGALGVPSPAFRGSAVISATAWRQPVLDDRGREAANLVGLAALAVDVAPPDADLAGETSSGEAAWPFSLAGPVNPFTGLQPDCAPLPAVTDPGRVWRACLPWVAARPAGP